MLLAEAAEASTSTYTSFDIYVLIFTVVIAIAVIRQLINPRRNLFALGFGTVSLLVFLFMDVIMIKGW
ncbi:hypothetical protein AB4114_24765 [Paenibacillus sp. 2RAB27]|uniref:DUF2759 family protein n=2 Tax=Paenibacillus TaxID=44249 RepID=A0ABX1XDY3_9BACL|nr:MULTISPECIES: hypothetical protein [Paenibacillus]KRE73556.1 hypothetical protein ASL11_06695 [Paenibacillus sp. Soil750]KRE97912.1 hypothetical protein ASG89_28830 [Paenibacillus sp. Soil766]NOU66690.1 hypothetical protein [Paenibacillus plantarum]CAH1215622.1 hypothetical protein PAECIP111891_04271 [Paenibacillus allorhizoplanae]